MFHSTNKNKLYDYLKEIELELDLISGKSKYDICQFLDDISEWMEKHRTVITEKYYPLGIISVGTSPIQLSAFLYGLFIGRAMEKGKLDITIKKKKLDKKEILQLMQENIKTYSKLFPEMFNYEKEDEGGPEKTKK